MEDRDRQPKEEADQEPDGATVREGLHFDQRYFFQIKTLSDELEEKLAIISEAMDLIVLLGSKSEHEIFTNM